MEECYFLAFAPLGSLSLFSFLLLELLLFGFSLGFGLFVFQDRLSLSRLGYPETVTVDQDGLKLRDLPAIAS